MRTEVLVIGKGVLRYALKELYPDAILAVSDDCDLKDFNQVDHLFETYRPERVLHLAAEGGGVQVNAARNTDLFETNVLINTNVLRAARRHGVSRLISILAGCAFRFFTDRPSTEGDLHRDLPFTGNLGYGYAKRVLDVHTKLLGKQFGLQYSSLTPVTAYGPYDNWDLETSHVVGSLIHRCYLAKQNDKPFEVWGSGRARRQFVYSLDVARVLMSALNFFTDTETMIVAPDEGLTIRELASLIAKIMGFDGPIVFDESKPEGELTRHLRSTKFSRFFPDFTFTPLEEGLTATVKWFCDNYDDVCIERRMKA